MKTPAFWYKSNSWQQYCLKPLAILYHLISRFLYGRRKSQRISIPVICVGNITAGGSGKTPTALALAETLSAHKVFFLTRGYGGHLSGPLMVDASHTFKDVGDEALLLAQYRPTCVAHDRYQGACFGERQGASLLIMDDGFQNPSLHKNISFLVFHGSQGIGNGSCLPAGPLREPFDCGMQRADAVIFYGEDQHHLLTNLQTFNKPIFKAHIIPDPEDIKALSFTPVFAFCGLGYPSKFYEMLRTHGIHVRRTKSFADHYAYQEKDMIALIQEAKMNQIQLVTTEKDYVRIPSALRKGIKIVRIKSIFEQPLQLIRFIESLIHVE